jgi:hypothetical protein
MDGARVLFDGGWGLLWSSNTQLVLVLRFEATDHWKPKKFAGIQETDSDVISSCPDRREDMRSIGRCPYSKPG